MDGAPGQELAKAARLFASYARDLRRRHRIDRFGLHDDWREQGVDGFQSALTLEVRLSLDLGFLLKSRDLLLSTERCQPLDLERADETIVWLDRAGPLTVSKIDSGRSSFYRLRLGDEVAVDVLPDGHLAVRSRPDVPDVTVEHFLADQFFPRVISQGDDLVLHSGAVRTDDGAILLLGETGSGKSTLSTIFHRDGPSSLMSDDAVVVQFNGDTPLASAIYPSLRLFPDSIEALFPESVASEEIGHYTDKQRIASPIGAESALATVPVTAIFLLDEPSSAEISIKPLAAAEACMAILKNSFALDPSDTDRARCRLARASDLANRVPSFAISYPRDYALLPAVRDRILAATGAGASL